jgi:uncharacterized protein
MRCQPDVFDLALVAVMFVCMAFEVRLFRHLCTTVESEPRARLNTYRFFIIYQWLLVGCICALWIAKKRHWSTLLLGVPNLLGFFVTLALAAAFIVFALLQRRTLIKRPDLWERVRVQSKDVEAIGPHTLAEHRVWTLAAVTAGCCEEIFFRGFLLAFFASFAGLRAAVAISAILFGIYHAYYGPKGILKTGAVGFVMSLLALWSASLVPVMIIHAAVDLSSGDTGYLVFSNEAKSPETALE